MSTARPVLAFVTVVACASAACGSALAIDEPTTVASPPDGGTAPIEAGASLPSDDDDPLFGLGPSTRVTGDFGKTDGALWQDGAFYWTASKPGTIYRLVPGEPAFPFRSMTSEPLGLAFNTKSRSFVACEIPADSDAQIERTSGDGNEVETLQVDFGVAAPWDSPNDVVVQDDGTMYVTDPGFQKEAKGGTVRNRLFRVAPSTLAVSEAAVIAAGSRPNGIVLSPDHRVLYLGFTAGPPGTGPLVVKLPVLADGSLGPAEDFVRPGEGSAPDGLAVDDRGNVFVATRSGVLAYSAKGKAWGTVPVEGATSVTFGGADRKTLLVTSSAGVFTFAMRLPGRSK